MSSKTHTAEFEKCVSQVVEQGHEKSSAFAICTDTFQKAAKPIFVGEAETQKLHLFCESIKLEGNKVSGVAIHPKRIFHPSEQMTHVYLKAELERAASSLAGKPFGIDHMYILPPPNIVTNSWYCKEKNGVCFEGLVDDHIAQQIREKAFKGISIELDWLRPGGSVEYVNGVAAKNFELTSLHLLKQFPPGDPDAFCKLIEAAEKKLAQMKEQLVVGPPLPLDQRVEALEQQLQDVLNLINVINGKLEVLTGTSSSPSATALPAQPGASQTTGVMKMKEAEWDPEYISNLPDSAFAVIAAGGDKDDEGKTTPRNLRKLPHHNTEGNLDLDHLRNALARVNQIEGGDKADAKKHLCSHARGEKAEDLVSEFCGEESTTQESICTMLQKLKEQGQADPEQCARDMLAAGMTDYEIVSICGVTAGDIERIRGELGSEALKKLREQQGNQEPEKDEHGCVIGKEKYDEENDKCVPIIAEAKVAFLEAKLRLKEQEGELTVDEIKQKIATLTTEREELYSNLEEIAAPERAQIQQRLDVLYAEIQAYEQALAAKIAGQVAPPETPPPAETDIQKVKETIVALRKKLVETEARVDKIVKQKKREAASWKEKYETLREAVKGAIPPPRIWKSWTVGPQRYVQEQLKILREIDS